jgi:hypothetical protein
MLQFNVFSADSRYAMVLMKMATKYSAIRSPILCSLELGQLQRHWLQQYHFRYMLFMNYPFRYWQQQSSQVHSMVRDCLDMILSESKFT